MTGTADNVIPFPVPLPPLPRELPPPNWDAIDAAIAELDRERERQIPTMVRICPPRLVVVR